jgi:hypothetical protein
MRIRACSRAFYANCVRRDTKYKEPKQRKECDKRDSPGGNLGAPEFPAPPTRPSSGYREEKNDVLELISRVFTFSSRALSCAIATYRNIYCWANKRKTAYLTEREEKVNIGASEKRQGMIIAVLFLSFCDVLFMKPPRGCAPVPDFSFLKGAALKIFSFYASAVGQV